MADENKNNIGNGNASVGVMEQDDGGRAPDQQKKEPKADASNEPKNLRVGSDGIKTSNGFVTVFDMSVDDGQFSRSGWKAESKSKITISGKGLGVYNQAYIRIAGSVYKGVNLTRSQNKVIFNLPDFLDLYRAGERIYLELYSSSDSKVTIRLIPSIIYKKEEKKEEDKGRESGSARQAQGEQGAATSEGGTAGPTGVAIAAGGDAIKGIFQALTGWQKKLLDALKDGDRQAAKDAISLAKKKGDSEILKKALAYAKENNLGEDYVKDIKNGLDFIDKNFHALNTLVNEPPYAAGNFKDDGSLDDITDDDITDQIEPYTASDQRRVEPKAWETHGGKTISRAKIEQTAGAVQSTSAAAQTVVSQGVSKAAVQAGGTSSAEIKVTDKRRVSGEVGQRTEVKQKTEVESESSVRQTASGKSEVSTKATGQASQNTSVISEISGQVGVSGSAQGTTQASVSGAISGNAQAVGQTAVGGAVSGGGGTGKVEGEIKISGEVGVGAGGNAGSGSVSAAVPQGVSASQKIEGQAAIPQNAPAESSQKANVTQQAGLQGQASQAGSGGDLSLKQSTEIAGEILDKNPGLISSDPKTQGKVLQALASNNLGDLEAPERVALKQALNSIQKSNPQDPKIAQAVNKLNGSLGGSSGEGPGEQSGEGLKNIQTEKPEESHISPKDLADKLQRASAAHKLSEADMKKSAKGTDGIVGPGAQALGKGGGSTGDQALGSHFGARQGQRGDGTDLSQNRIDLEGLPSSPTDGEQAGQEGGLKSTNPESSKGVDENYLEAKRQFDQEEEERAQKLFDQMGAVAGISDEQRDKFEKQKELDEAIQMAVIQVNTVLDQTLNTLALDVWAFAIPTFGLTILAGAIVGDIILMAKNIVIKMAIKKFLNSMLLAIRMGSAKKINLKDIEAKSDEIARGIKISVIVKAHIAGMNAVLVLLILLAIVLVAGFIYYGCHYPLDSMPILKVAGYGDICKSIDSFSGSGFGF